MKKFVKLIALFLAVVLLVGCSDSGGKRKIDLTMNEAETAIADQLKGLYENPNEETIKNAVFNADGEVLTALGNQLSNVIKGGSQGIIVKEIESFNCFRVFAVAVNYTDYSVNDVLLIGEYEGNNYIVLQQMYTAEAQESISSAYILHENEFEDIFSASNKQFGLTAVKKTALSITDEENYLTDDDDNALEFTGGAVKDATLSIEEIIMGDDNAINVSGGLHGGEGGSINNDPSGGVVGGNNNQNSTTSAPVGDSIPQTLNGRTLTWNIEFNENNMGIVSSRLTTGVANMNPDRKYLFTSTGGDNYFVEKGDLVLRLSKNANGNSYTTAHSVSTSGKMSYKYGYVEMRAKIPYSDYVWPGFWMKPDLNLKKSQYHGEIDIFEVFGSKDTLYFNLHKWPAGMQSSEQIGNRGKYTGNRKYKFSNASNLSNEYHIYGFEWTKDYMKAYIDGKCYYEVSIKEEDDYSTKLPGMDCFHDYYFLCWDLMLWEYNGQKEISTPADYRIDYVRLYQHKDSESIKIY